MKYSKWLQWSVLPLATSSWLACVSTPATNGPDAGALDSDEKALFSCVLDASAPHKRIDILEITLSPDEVAAAKEADRDADDEPPTDPDTTTMDTNVRMNVNEVEQGLEGHCFRRNDGGRYACQSFDNSLKLEWSAETPKDQAPAGQTTVKVRENWLFGTKEYSATCTRKG